MDENYNIIEDKIRQVGKEFLIIKGPFLFENFKYDDYKNMILSYCEIILKHMNDFEEKILIIILDLTFFENLILKTTLIWNGF